MRKALFVLMILAMIISALAAQRSDVAYTGGTVSQLKEDVVGCDLCRARDAARFLRLHRSMNVSVIRARVNRQR